MVIIENGIFDFREIEGYMINMSPKIYIDELKQEVYSVNIWLFNRVVLNFYIPTNCKIDFQSDKYLIISK